jgi:hypothetical protein
MGMLMDNLIKWLGKTYPRNKKLMYCVQYTKKKKKVVKRGVYLLPLVGKILPTILSTRLSGWLMKNKGSNIIYT